MNRIIALASIAMLGIGCTTVTPVGPMAKMFPPKEKKGVQETVEPIVQQAQKPVPPALLVTPGEVTESNYQQAIEKLKQEMEQDRRSLEAMPNVSEISTLSGRQSSR
ncbi:MAG: hypothetical protein U0798_02820 [Gemmataceae bacterium]